MLLRGLVARSKVAGIVAVDAVGDDSKAQLRAQLLEHVEELGLAEVAAVGGILGVVRILHLVRRDEAMREPHVLGYGPRHLPVTLWIGWGIRRHGQRPVAQSPVRRVCQVGGIDAPRVRHQQPLAPRQAFQQRRFLGLRIRHGGRIRRPGERCQ